MTTHDLKTWPEYFQAVIEGRKTFEIRSTADRHFAVGDELNLREFYSDPDTCQKSHYTGRECEAKVTYILEGPHAILGYAVMSIKLLTVTNLNWVNPWPNDVGVGMELLEGVV